MSVSALSSAMAPSSSAWNMSSSAPASISGGVAPVSGRIAAAVQKPLQENCCVRLSTYVKTNRYKIAVIIALTIGLAALIATGSFFWAGIAVAVTVAALFYAAMKCGPRGARAADDENEPGMAHAAPLSPINLGPNGRLGGDSAFSPSASGSFSSSGTTSSAPSSTDNAPHRKPFA